jgi:hypothetical protein
MIKINSWKINESTVITVDGKTVAVATLPDDIRFDFQTYDRLRQEYLDCLYLQEKLHLAVNGKLNEIFRKIKALEEPKTTVGEDK